MSNEWTLINEPFPLYDYIVCILVFIGILGNSLVIFIKVRHPGSFSNVGVTETNNVINRLIIGLAAADLLTAVFILPIPEFVNVPRNAAGEFYCRVVESRTLAWICFTASVFTLTTISIERYLAVVHPHYYRARVHKRHTKLLFPAIWISAITIGIHIIAFHTVGECDRCDSEFPSTFSRRINGIFVFVIEYIGPLFIMTYTSIRAVYVLTKSKENAEETVRSVIRQSSGNERIRRRLT